MANGAILTAEQERKLRQPIDEYVGPSFRTDSRRVCSSR